MFGVLAKVSPLDPTTGARVEVRVSSFGRRDGAVANGLGGVKWEPSVIARPTLRVNLWNGDFTSPLDASSITLPINIKVLAETWPDVRRYVWTGAPIELYAADHAAPWPWPVLFSGKVSSNGGVGARTMLQAETDLEPFRVRVLTEAYQGTGGSDGGADLKNRVKPLAIGWCRNVEPVLLNAEASIYQFSAYGPMEAVDVLYERGSPFPAALADYDDYDALDAATIAPGTYATCLDEGLVRLGAPAAGVITGDIRGYAPSGTTPRLTGAVIQAIAGIAGISSTRFEAATLAALDVDKPYPINLLLTEQSEFIDVAQALALAANWVSQVSPAGKFFVSDVGLSGAAAINLDAQGKALPQVAASEELDVSPPYYRTTMGAERSWRVHTADEIAFQAELVERGLWKVDETYREGNIVSDDSGGRWVYVGTEPSSGNPLPVWPATSNFWWENLTPPLALAQQLIGYLTNPTHTVAADSAGNVPSYADAGGEFLVTFGGVELDDDAAYSVVSTTGGLSIGIDAHGVYLPTGLTSNYGTARLRAAYDGHTVELIYSLAKAPEGEDGDDGSDAVAIVLSNEFQGVPSDADGGNPDLTDANGQLRVYNTLGEITGTVTIGTAIAVGCTGTVNTAANTPVGGQPKGYYRATAMSADSAHLDIPVTVGLITVTKRFTLSKNKTRASVKLKADPQFINYDGAGNPLPPTQTVTLDVEMSGVGGTISAWQVANMTGGFANVTGQITIDGDTLGATMSRAQFEAIAGATRGVRIKIRKLVSGIYIEDIVTITRVQQGADGVDGLDAKLLRIYSTRYGITYDASGALAPASQPTTFIAEKINTTATVTWSVRDANGNLRTPTTNYLSSATGDSVNQSATQFDAARNGTKGILITATLSDGGTLTDTATQVQVPQGAAAIGFVQDSPTPTAQFVSQTWYRPTSKQWFRWSGSAWVRILGDLSALDSVGTDEIDPNAVTQTVSALTAASRTVSGSSIYPNLLRWAQCDITTAGGKVHLMAEILAHLYAQTADLSLGEQMWGEFALMRGPASTNITDVMTLAAYDALANTVQLITPTRFLEYIYSGGSSYSATFSNRVLVPFSYIDTVNPGSYRYSIWARPGSAEQNIATNYRQYIKLMEVKR